MSLVMHFLFIIFLFQLTKEERTANCESGFLKPKFEEKHSSTLKISTFNTYFLFNRTKEEKAIVPWENREQVDNHIKNVVSVLDTINADIYNVVEVESCNILSEVIHSLRNRKNKTYDVFMVKGKDTYTEQQNGLVTSIRPLTEVFRVEDRIEYPLNYSKCGFSREDDTGLSKHFFTIIKLSDKLEKVIFASVHLKAIPNDIRSCAQREAQGEVVTRQIKKMMEENQTKSVMIMGDFNDYDFEVPDVSGNVPLSQTITHMKEELMLTNVLELVSESNRYTYWWDDYDELSSLDHILVTDDILKYVTKVKIEKDLYPKGNYNYSDHWAVTMTLDTNPVDYFSYIVIIVMNVIIVVSLFAFIIGFIIFIIYKSRDSFITKKKEYQLIEKEYA